MNIVMCLVLCRRMWWLYEYCVVFSAVQADVVALNLIVLCLECCAGGLVAL